MLQVSFSFAYAMWPRPHVWCQLPCGPTHLPCDFVWCQLFYSPAHLRRTSDLANDDCRRSGCLLKRRQPPLSAYVNATRCLILTERMCDVPTPVFSGNAAFRAVLTYAPAMRSPARYAMSDAQRAQQSLAVKLCFPDVFRMRSAGIAAARISEEGDRHRLHPPLHGAVRRGRCEFMLLIARSIDRSMHPSAIHRCIYWR